MPTVRIGQPMTHLILSAAGPLPKEKKLPIRSWRASIYPGGVDPDGLNLDHVSWESGNQWHAPSRSHSPFPQHRDDALAYMREWTQRALATSRLASLTDFASV